MDRYKIALNKNPADEVPKTQIETFGFNALDQELNDRADLNRRRPFSCAPGTNVGRVGIIAEDLNHIFVTGQVHFFNKAYLLCDHGDCCKISAPAQRIACCLVIYEPTLSDLDNSRVVPWVFGRVVFNKLKDLNNLTRLDRNDFQLSKPGANPYNTWEVQAAPISSSLWQKYEAVKKRLLVRASLINLADYIGRPITNEDLVIGQRESNHQPQYRQRGIRGRRDEINDLFSDIA